MVQANAKRGQVIFVNAKEPGNLPLHMVNAVAQPHHGYACFAANGAADGGHRIGIVEEMRIRAQVGHVAGDVQHLRDHPHGARDTTRHGRVADRLKDAMTAGNFDIALPAFATPDGNGCYYEICARKDSPPIGGRGDRDRSLLGRQHLGHQFAHRIQRDRFDIHKCQFPKMRFPGEDDVRHQPLGEYRAARADQHKFQARHRCFSLCLY